MPFVPHCHPGRAQRDPGPTETHSPWVPARASLRSLGRDDKMGMRKAPVETPGLFCSISCLFNHHSFHRALMLINKLRIINYKSFEDSGWIEFTSGFNVVAGKNSSGKTALLEALRLTDNNSHPHLSLRRRRGAAVPPDSIFLLEMTFAEHELTDTFSRLRQIEFPIATSADHNSVEARGRALVTSFFENPAARLSFKVQGRKIHPIQYPSHGLFERVIQHQQIFMRVQSIPEHQSYRLEGVSGGDSDTVLNLVADMLPRKLYVFKAERLNIGKIAFAEEKILTSNASNLPRVLFSMMTNQVLFERYNRHVNQIFPYIKRVTVFPKGQEIEVRLWWVDPTTERDDLTIPLLESGTGIGQALAILYVVMTIERGIIVIDEPNSFLHPGAAKVLIEILRQYNHQYIVSTHSPEIISTADPSALFITRWEDGNSRVEKLERSVISEQRKLLSELGVSAVDVFGADRIVWVEGQTEQECFPLILQQMLGHIPPGLDFVAVRSVDEIVRKQGTDALVMELYRRLSHKSTMLPEAIHFSFDREKRTEEYIAKIESETNGRVKFLPMRCYESFLLHPDAIANALTSEAMAQHAKPISTEEVLTWLNAHAEKYESKRKWTGTIEDVDWRKAVDSVSILRDIFRHFVKVEYSKTKHSRALTEWILEHDREHLSQLSKYVAELATK